MQLIFHPSSKTLMIAEITSKSFYYYYPVSNKNITKHFTQFNPSQQSYSQIILNKKSSVFPYSKHKGKMPETIG